MTQTSIYSQLVPDLLERHFMDLREGSGIAVDVIDLSPVIGLKMEASPLVIQSNIMAGTNSVGDPRALFSHLLLNLPQVLASSMPDATGGQR